MPTRAAATALTVLFTLAWPAAATAQDEGRVGGYVQVGASLGLYTFLEGDIERKLTSLGNIADVRVDPGGGINFVSGFQPDGHLAMEVYFDYLFSTGISIDGTRAAKFDTWSVVLRQKILVPFRERYQAFGTIGLGIAGANGKDSQTIGVDTSQVGLTWQFGAGLDTYLNENVAVVFEANYRLPTRNVAEFDAFLLNLGLRYQYSLAGLPF